MFFDRKVPFSEISKRPPFDQSKNCFVILVLFEVKIVQFDHDRNRQNGGFSALWRLSGNIWRKDRRVYKVWQTFSVFTRFRNGLSDIDMNNIALFVLYNFLIIFLKCFLDLNNRTQDLTEQILTEMISPHFEAILDQNDLLNLGTVSKIKPWTWFKLMFKKNFN